MNMRIEKSTLSAISAAQHKAAKESKGFTKSGRAAELKGDEITRLNAVKRGESQNKAWASNAEFALKDTIAVGRPAAIRINEILVEMHSIAQQGAGGSLSDAEISAQLQPIYNSLMDQIDRIVADTDSANTIAIFDPGVVAAPPLPAGGAAIAVNVGNGVTINIPARDARHDDAAGLGDLTNPGVAMDEQGHAAAAVTALETAMSRISVIIGNLNLAANELSDRAETLNTRAADFADEASAIEAPQLNEKSIIMADLADQIGIMMSLFAFQNNVDSEAASTVKSMLRSRG